MRHNQDLIVKTFDKLSAAELYEILRLLHEGVGYAAREMGAERLYGLRRGLLPERGL